ncbi:MAG: hypothetical protein HQK86_03205 [Nitrospinae bacterium]|nr:hypothetical protein [Nitrospinota bacterium]
MDDDFFALETLIIERVRSQVSELTSVKGLSNLAARPDDIVKPPVGYIMFYGYEAGGGKDTELLDGEQVITQKWLVQLIVKDQDMTHGKQARVTAGVLLSKISAALRVWDGRPAKTSPLTLVTGPLPELDADGFWSFPLLFKTSFPII